MKMKLTVIMVAAFAITASADIQFSGGLVGIETNWVGGVLPTTSANPGVITNGVSGTIGDGGSLAETNAVGLYVRQEGGSISSVSYRGSKFSGTTWTINGGSISGNGVSLQSGSLMTLNSGGSVSMAANRVLSIDTTSIFTINGGTLTAGKQLALNGIFNINGGTATVVGSVGTGFNNAGTINFNGGSFTAVSWGKDTKVLDRTLNFGAGPGTVHFGAFEPYRTTMDWDSASEFELTIDGADAAFFEDLWTNGVITIDGTNSGAFADTDFIVSGSTLSVLFDPSLVPPAAPTGLTATGGFSVVTLDWDDSGADVASYRLYRSTVSNSFDSALASNLTTSAYSDSAIVNGTTYYYRLTAVGTNGVESGFSDQVFATPVQDPSAPPPAPTGLVATEGVSEVTLDWDDSGADVASYSVYRATTSGGFTTALATNLSASAYTDSSVVNGTPYYYAVSALGTNGIESALSDEDSATPLAPSFTTFTGASTNNNYLSNVDNWDNGLPNVVGRQGTISINAGYDSNASHTDYDVVHTAGTISRDNGFSGLSLGSGTVWLMDGATAAISGTRGIGVTDAQFTLNQGNANLTDNNKDSSVSGSSGSITLNGGTMTVGRNLAVRDGGSLTINGGTLTGIDLISCPGFSGAAGPINFNGGTTTADRFALDTAGTVTFGGSTAGSLTLDSYGNGATLDWLPGSQMTLSITNETNWVNWAEGLWNDGKLKYNGQGTNELSNTWAEVTAENGLDSGVRFNYDSATKTLYLAGDALPLPPPTGLAATASDGSVSLDWNDISDPALASYSVFRSETSGSYGSALASGLSASDYVDSSAVNGTTYYYVVTATKTNSLESSQSAEVSATPGDFVAPAAPTGLAATPGDSTVSLNWNDNSEGDIDRYSVYRSETSGDYGSALATNVSSSDYADNTAANDTTYYYVVTATDTSGNESAQSGEVSATPNDSGLVGYALWLSVNGVADTDENFYEYAMDGDPTDGQPPANEPVLIKSGSSLLYVHPQRSDDASLTYTVETTGDLPDSGSWTNTGYTVTGTNVTGGTLDFVTNGIDTVESEKFIRLKVGQ